MTTSPTLRPGSSRFRAFFLDYDGTLTGGAGGGPSGGPSGSSTALTLAPGDALLAVLRALAADDRNRVFLFSSAPRADLAAWFASIVSGGGAGKGGGRRLLGGWGRRAGGQWQGRSARLLSACGHGRGRHIPLGPWLSALVIPLLPEHNCASSAGWLPFAAALCSPFWC